jgi:carboxyl-terminal processing protease
MTHTKSRLEPGFIRDDGRLRYTMKKIILLFWAIFGVSNALASPAMDLFQQATRFISENYNGYSSANPVSIAEQLRGKLQEACQPAGESCSYETARPFLVQLTQRMNDGHTYFLSPQSYADLLRAYSGQSLSPEPTFGFTFSNANLSGEVLVNHVIADSPAAIAGLQPFDRIVRLNGERLEFKSAVQQLRTAVNVKASMNILVARGDVERPGIFELNLKRAQVEKTNLPLLYQPANAPTGVLMLKIPTFVGSQDIAPRTHELVAQAVTSGAKSIVVDLRGNGGGEETECYGAASAFVGRVAHLNATRFEQVTVGFDGGKLLGNDPKDSKRYDIQNPALWNGNVAVLVNRYTASCGELMAYVLQQNKRAQVIGEDTHGLLDTATETWELMDRSALAITYVRTLNLDGSRLPTRVTPDVEMSSSLNEIAETGRDPMLDAALEVLAQTTTN